MCQSRTPLSTPLSLSPPLPLSATAIGNAYNDEQARPFGPFALLYYTRIIFKSQLGLPPLSHRTPSPLAMLRGWKNNFENLFSLILIRCKSFAFPPFFAPFLYIGHGHSSACIANSRGRRRRRGRGECGTVGGPK